MELPVKDTQQVLPLTNPLLQIQQLLQKARLPGKKTPILGSSPDAELPTGTVDGAANITEAASDLPPPKQGVTGNPNNSNSKTEEDTIFSRLSRPKFVPNMFGQTEESSYPVAKELSSPRSSRSKSPITTESSDIEGDQEISLQKSESLNKSSSNFGVIDSQMFAGYANQSPHYAPSSNNNSYSIPLQNEFRQTRLKSVDELSGPDYSSRAIIQKREYGGSSRNTGSATRPVDAKRRVIPFKKGVHLKGPRGFGERGMNRNTTFRPNHHVAHQFKKKRPSQISNRSGIGRGMSHENLIASRLPYQAQSAKDDQDASVSHGWSSLFCPQRNRLGSHEPEAVLKRKVRGFVSVNDGDEEEIDRPRPPSLEGKREEGTSQIGAQLNDTSGVALSSVTKTITPSKFGQTRWKSRLGVRPNKVRRLSTVEFSVDGLAGLGVSLDISTVSDDSRCVRRATYGPFLIHNESELAVL